MRYSLFNIHAIALSIAGRKRVYFWCSILDVVPQQQGAIVAEKSFLGRQMFMRQGTRDGPGDISIWDRASISYSKYFHLNESVGRKSS